MPSYFMKYHLFWYVQSSTFEKRSPFSEKANNSKNTIFKFYMFIEPFETDNFLAFEALENTD